MREHQKGSIVRRGGHFFYGEGGGPSIAAPNLGLSGQQRSSAKTEAAAASVVYTRAALFAEITRLVGLDYGFKAAEC